MSETNQKLLFLATKHFDANASIRGAFLLTDENTKPIEFRCTNPIRPTQLQTMLYGDILKDHILIELIGEPLIKTLKEMPDIILVAEPEFLALRAKVNVPVVLIAKDEQIIAVGGNQSDFQMLSSGSGQFEPIVFTTNDEFPQDRLAMKDVLTDIFNKNNLIEPFTRIASALEQVHIQKIGEMKE